MNEKWVYNFPEYALDTDISRQTAKVLEEICEVFLALCNGESMERVAEEAMDVGASHDQLIRLIEAEGVDVGKAKREVIAKNTARGYYGGEEPCM